jgi:hypothetical protein
MRFDVCGFCLRRHLANGEVAKMTDEERQQCCTELRTADELAFYWRKLAADEIERLAEENYQLKRRVAGLESEIVCLSYDTIR